MHNADARTLGKYFAGLDPETVRIRGRWTARQMYIDEFNLICDTQSAHHPNVLTDDFRKDLYSAVFFQRPLTQEERLHLLDALMRQGDLTFARIKSKKCLSLPKGTKFNFEQDDEEKGLPATARTRSFKRCSRSNGTRCLTTGATKSSWRF